ncbi:acetate--CoA ligase [Halioxenophilus sp. WMMB6]|uniref:acetate--CoA ligase n=1 Tax=Halioxenophilus sp. WMMB6 TaxID=3073815 RepID=UPI00295EC028|nr:acetate--CoA ligase [Halioxenophilus sp. WMMB6]
MSSNLYPVADHVRERALVSPEQYEAMYEASINQPDEFWAAQAKRVVWRKPFSVVKDTSFDKNDLHIRWFADGELNVTESCLDRHLAENGDKIAIYWEPDSEGGATRSYTYQQLSDAVNRAANGLKSLGVKKGDVVTVYLPMVPELSITMLACARIGAIHSVVFGGFSPEAIAGRIEDGHSKIVVTADHGLRAGKHIPLKANVDKAIEHTPAGLVETVVVLKHTGESINWHNGRDHDFNELVSGQSSDCPAEVMNAEDPLFILYTSGSTGKPKGVLHTTGGYLVYTSLSHEYVFNYTPDQVYWCMADIGWITGHSYAVYGPLSNAATCVMYEGVPNHPDSGRLARIIDKYQVNILYTAPTAIRALMAHGDEPVAGASLSSLLTLATAGEPINPEAWRWFHEKFGHGNCPIMDTWWQTETGGMMLTPFPGVHTLKPGSANRPFFGIKPALLDNEGNVLEGEASGNLVITDSWPSQMRTIYGDHERFIETYFSSFAGCYFTSDGAKRDADGDYWITGRVDDVLNVSGHRLGTAEIESALVSHDSVAEAAVVGYPHDIKGQGIYVYVTLNTGIEPTPEMKKQLIAWVREDIGPIATPDIIQWAPQLPKTRSGKIMRRILRKIATDEYENLGDISTLMDPGVVQHLIDDHNQLKASHS